MIYTPFFKNKHLHGNIREMLFIRTLWMFLYDKLVIYGIVCIAFKSNQDSSSWRWFTLQDMPPKCCYHMWWFNDVIRISSIECLALKCCLLCCSTNLKEEEPRNGIMLQLALNALCRISIHHDRIVQPTSSSLSFFFCTIHIKNGTKGIDLIQTNKNTNHWHDRQTLPKFGSANASVYKYISGKFYHPSTRYEDLQGLSINKSGECDLIHVRSERGLLGCNSDWLDILAGQHQIYCCSLVGSWRSCWYHQRRETRPSSYPHPLCAL